MEDKEKKMFKNHVKTKFLIIFTSVTLFLVSVQCARADEKANDAFSGNIIKKSKTDNTFPVQAIPEEDNRLGTVFDLERSSHTDILLLRNSDKLTGTILNDSFRIRTSYAKIKLNIKTIAGIDLEGGKDNIETIITVNNNRFSGFIDDPVFVFKLQSGAQIQIRREKVLKAIFRIREAERQGIPQSQFILLKNGDFFTGKITNDRVTIATTYAKVPLNTDQANSITLIGGKTPLTKVLMLNGDTLQGVLETEDIAVELDVGSKAKIYKDRMDVIYCQYGFIPPQHVLFASLATKQSGRSVVPVTSTAYIAYT